MRMKRSADLKTRTSPAFLRGKARKSAREARKRKAAEIADWAGSSGENCPSYEVRGE